MKTWKIPAANAQEFAAYTKSVFGAPVCYACGQKRKAQADAQKESEA